MQHQPAFAKQRWAPLFCCLQIFLLVPTNALGANLIKTKSEDCDYIFSLPKKETLRPTHVEEFKAAKDELTKFDGARNDGVPRLCLNNGDGGDYQSALQIIKVLAEVAVTTVVRDGDECNSACALIFLAGQRSWGGVKTSYFPYWGPHRMLHIGGRLGYHAPFLTHSDQTTKSAKIQEVYTEGVQAIADLLKLEDQEIKYPNRFPRALLGHMLAAGPGELFVIDKVWQALAWDITLFGYDIPPPKTEADLHRACWNKVSWEELRRDGRTPRKEELKETSVPGLASKKLSMHSGLNRTVLAGYGEEAAFRCVVDYYRGASSAELEIQLVERGNKIPPPGKSPTRLSRHADKKNVPTEVDYDYWPLIYFAPTNAVISELPRSSHAIPKTK